MLYATTLLLSNIHNVQSCTFTQLKCDVCDSCAVGKMKNASKAVDLSVTDDEPVQNVSAASLSFPQPFESLIVGLVTSVTGMCANAVVVVVLIFARRHFGSSVNTLITNQSLMDLFACIFLTITLAMSFSGSPPDFPWLGHIGNEAVCFLFRSRLLVFFCMASEKIGLALTEGLNAGHWYDAEENRVLW